MQVETDLEIRILQGNQLVAKGVLQASQVNDAPALAFRVVSLPLVPGPGTLEVKLRQATDAVEKKFQFQMPLARRQVISLELQNAELLKLLRARGATVATSPSSVDGVPETALLRRGEFQENSQMRHQQLLEESYAFNAQQLQRKQQLRRRLSAMKMFNSELPRLRQNLAKALARQQQLQSEGEAKVSALQRRLAEAQEKALPEVEAQALVALALGRREELQRQCRDALEARREEQMSPEVAHLRKLSMEQQEELLRRREQIVQIEQSGHYQAWKRHEEKVAEVQQLFQSLEELSRAMQDDQVCHESETQELRQERNAIKDRLEDAISSLRQLSTRAELLQPSAAAETTASAAAAGTAPEWQRRVWRAEGELKELKRMEALRLQQIKDLEMDQENLVEQTTLATSLGEDAAETKMANLERSQAELQASVQSKKLRVQETQQLVQQLQAYIRRLQAQQLQLVTRADERVLRNPQPTLSATAKA